MKQVTYPARLTILIDAEHGEMLDKLCAENGQSRPVCVNRAIAAFFAHVFPVRERDKARRKDAA